MHEDIFSLLKFFEGFHEAQLSLLRSLFLPCECPENTVLFEQGTPASFLYIVVSGEVVVNFKPDDAPSLVVARVRPGGVVGWSAALGSRSYTSEAVVVAPSQLLRVSGHDLRSLCEEYPETGSAILDRLAAVIAERLRNTHPQVKAMLESALLVSKSANLPSSAR